MDSYNPPTSSELPYPPPYLNVNQATPVINWLPPLWFGLPQYDQYQLGLLYLNEEHNTGGEI